MSESNPRLSPQQARPLDVREASVALSAGAGCGKTTVLTSRFLNDLDGPEARPLGEIVALTFTEKAARELRKRIRQRCREKLHSGNDPARWRAVLRGLEAAPIGTFHEFCGQWLRTHAVEAGIDPDFVILDATIAGAVRDEALGKCVRQWLAARDPDLIELAVEFGLTRVRQAIADLLTERAAGQLAEWHERTPAEVVGIWQEAWQLQGRARLLRKVAEVARPCLMLLNEHEPTHATMRERRAVLLEYLPRIEGDGRSGDVLQTIVQNARVQGGGSKNHWPSPEIYEAVKEGFDAVRTAIKKCEEKSRWDEAATLEAAESGLRLARLVLRARQAYEAAKRARGGLDFDDLLTLTRDVLRNRTAAGEHDNPIARLLVDEFQDTDPVQSEILESLTGDQARAGRLFLVGDFKQSIYRFRGARPEIFQEFRARFPEEGRHALTENFRSVPAILDFVNALFAESFPGPDTALLPAAHWPDRDDQPAVEFLWAEETDESENERGSIHDRRKLEARWIARRLRQRLDAGWMIRDRVTNQPRRANAGDIALLFRAMTDVAPYEAALSAEGFDYHTVGGAAFYVQQEVHDLINVLSAIEDPLDPVALAGALRSPFFCLSDDGLFWLATAPGGLVRGLLAADGVAALSELDRTHALRARALLAGWRGLKDRSSIAALLDIVLAESGYEAALLGEPLGERKRANARKLVRMARRFDQQGGFTLANFVARLRADLKSQPREEQAATTDEEGTSVRLLSIHQAKGLEFPVVVLPDLNRRPPARFEAVAFHPLLGPLVRPSRDPSADPGTAEADDDSSRQSLGWLTYQAIEQREEDDEALRLFYVATTRARDALILSAARAPSEKAYSPAMATLDERFDRETGRCRAELPEGWRQPRVHVTRECPGPTAGPERRASWRLPLIESARTIEQAPLRADVPSIVPQCHRFVDLDPAQGLAAGAARLDRLTRHVLADPKLFRTDDWPGLIARVARRYDPLLSTRLIDELVKRLRPWIDGALGRTLARSPAIERAVEWSLTWPPDASDATVFRGTLDLLARDDGGHAEVMLWSDAAASEPRERLRLLLSARAADLLELGPVRRAWRIRLGPGGGLEGEDSWDHEAIDAAIQSLPE